jgi:hypothetical protein
MDMCHLIAWGLVPHPDRPSRIVAAAIQLRDGTVVTDKDFRVGFITDKGKFVNPWTAATLARVAGQVPCGIKNPKNGLSKSDLTCGFSENIGES